MKIRELVSPGWVDASEETRLWLARLLKAEGVELSAASGAQLARGTPVYIRGDVPAVEAQRLMALNHIRRLPVIEGDELIGIVDLVDLVLRGQAAAG